MLDSWTMAERDYQLGFRFFSALNCYLLISMLVFIKLMIQRLRAICIKQGRSSTKIVGGGGGGGWKGLKKYRPPWQTDEENFRFRIVQNGANGFEVFVFFLEYFEKYSGLFLFVKIIYAKLFLSTWGFFHKNTENLDRFSSKQNHVDLE